MIAAARVATTFALDPLDVLGGYHGRLDVERTDPGLAWSLRVAAHNVIMEERRADAAQHRAAPDHPSS